MGIIRGGHGLVRFCSVFCSFLDRTDLSSLDWVTNQTEPTMVGQVVVGAGGDGEVVAWCWCRGVG